MAEDYESIKSSIAKRYPLLGRRLQNFSIQRGERKEYTGKGGLEYYDPEESYSPNYGKPTIELFDDDLQGRELEDAIAGDALHYLGGTNSKDEPHDPEFYKMKQDFVESLTQQQLSIDLDSYNRRNRSGEERRPFSDWFRYSRSDAYLRGYLFPDKNDEWRKNGAYTPEQEEKLEQMRKYLQKQD